MTTLTDLVEVDAFGADRDRAAGSRGLVLGSVHDRGGRHLASFTQELLIRPAAPEN